MFNGLFFSFFLIYIFSQTVSGARTNKLIEKIGKFRNKNKNIITESFNNLNLKSNFDSLRSINFNPCHSLDTNSKSVLDNSGIEYFNKSDNNFTFKSTNEYHSLEFPEWLSDFTGIDKWPGMDPPYIPLDFIDFNIIENHVPIHKEGECSFVQNNSESCSFDCYGCYGSGDISTCNKIAQTFDDGPSPLTVKLINEYKGSSTFFTLGINVVRYPEIYRYVYLKGHLMASHTWSHRFLPSLSNEDIIAQIEWSIWSMNATSGHLPKYFRPPYGGIDNRVRSIVNQFGLKTVLWNYDTLDWKLVNSDSNINDQLMLNLKNFKDTNDNQGIILEHDTTEPSVDLGIKINNEITNDQISVAQCVNDDSYLGIFY